MHRDSGKAFECTVEWEKPVLAGKANRHDPAQNSKPVQRQTSGFEFSTLDAMCKALGCGLGDVLAHVKRDPKKGKR